MHVGLVIHMFNRSSGTLKGFSSIVSDFKMLVGLHDFADALLQLFSAGHRSATPARFFPAHGGSSILA